MKLVRYLIPVLCILLGSGVCRAQVAGDSKGFCFSGVQDAASNLSCAEAVQGASAYEELRSRLWGEVVRQVWKNSRKRHQRSQLDSAEESEENQKEDAWKRMLREADYDLSVSSHRLVMSMSVRF
jgi:hypothetical protein